MQTDIRPQDVARLNERSLHYLSVPLSRRHMMTYFMHFGKVANVAILFQNSFFIYDLLL